MTVKVLGHSNPAARGNVGKDYHDSNIALEVQVNDQKIRDLGLEHDGYEKPFALVPTRDGSWKRVDLEYSGASYTRFGSSTPNDTYRKVLDGWTGDVSLDDLRNKGVAFGIDVSGPNGQNSSTVWLQGFDDNYKLRD